MSRDRPRVMPIAVALSVTGAVLNTGPYALAVHRLRTSVFPRMSGLGRGRTVAITFDDGPDMSSTPQILDELDRLGLVATFFVLGDMVRRAPSLTREIVARGHEVGLHGDVHRSHVLRSPRSVVADMRRAHDLVTRAINRPPVYFRPPYGSLSSASLVTARRLGLTTVLWSAWGKDWRAESTPATVMAELDADLRHGACILLHDSDCTSAPRAWTSTLGALPMLAEELRRRDLEAVPLAKHLAAP